MPVGFINSGLPVNRPPPITYNGRKKILFILSGVWREWKKLSRDVDSPNIQNKKNSIRNIWRNQKNITIFAEQKKFTMRPMQSHIKIEFKFNPDRDYADRGACFAIE